MPRGTKQDSFVNRAYAGVTMSAANTITFDQIQTGVSMFDRLAWIIQRITFIPAFAAWQQMAAETDSFDIALTTSDSLSALGRNQAQVIDVCSVNMLADGAPVNIIQKYPSDFEIVHDFSSLAGGGMLVPANTLYLGMDTAGATAASEANAVIWFLYKKLTDAEYIELVQAMQVVS